MLTPVRSPRGVGGSGRSGGGADLAYSTAPGAAVRCFGSPSASTGAPMEWPGPSVHNRCLPHGPSQALGRAEAVNDRVHGVTASGAGPANCRIAPEAWSQATVSRRRLAAVTLATLQFLAPSGGHPRAASTDRGQMAGDDRGRIPTTRIGCHQPLPNLRELRIPLPRLGRRWPGGPITRHGRSRLRSVAQSGSGAEGRTSVHGPAGRWGVGRRASPR